MADMFLNIIYGSFHVDILSGGGDLLEISAEGQLVQKKVEVS